jgi:peptide/nickel transport system permease protein
VVGGVIILILLVLAALAPWIVPYRFDEMSLLQRLKPPSAAHWFGTDESGAMS